MQLDDEPCKPKQALLTIAIPTYNRASYLELCLRRISEELAGLNANQRDLVVIYVSDNASADSTTHVIFQFQSLNPERFKMVRNDVNIGGDRNISQCYESATTPYVWVLGDDDLILPGGLKSVLDVLFLQDVDILYVNNYWFIDSYLGTRYSPKLRKHQVSFYINPLTFARKTNVMLTFISGLIVRNRTSFDYHADVAAGRNLSQFGWVLPQLRDGNRFAIIEDWVVAAKGANSGGYGLVRVFGHNLVKISNEILRDKPDVARAIQNGTIVNFFTGFVLEFRKGNSKFSDKDMGTGLQKAFHNNWRYYIFLWPLILLPLPLARIYNVLLKVFRRLFRSVLV